MLYHVFPSVTATILPASTLSKGRFQPGRRLAPFHGLAQPVPFSKQQTYYIPTESEAHVEERNSSMERETMEGGQEVDGGRRISVKIDKQSREYSGILKIDWCFVGIFEIIIQPIAVNVMALQRKMSNFSAMNDPATSISGYDVILSSNSNFIQSSSFPSEAAPFGRLHYPNNFIIKKKKN